MASTASSAGTDHMILKRIYFTATILLVLAEAASASPKPLDNLTLTEARQYMLELINKDRASLGLKPVKLDPIATEAGQKHAEEMAVKRYLSHWNLAGKLPDQRYTEAGGTDFDRENVFLQTSYARGADREALTLVKDPTFLRKEIEKVESAYFNEVPPNDGHRRNILRPEHTHVGIALAKAEGDGSESFANSQEFVDRYTQDITPIPQSISIGERVVIAGRTAPGVTFKAISVGRFPLPSPMNIEELKATTKYSYPREYITFYPEADDISVRFSVTPDGQFRVRIPLSDRGESGLYYVIVWVRDKSGVNRIASQRTVVVK
jgi:hypothetical protein